MAWDINQAVLVGRLTRDPLTSQTNSGTPFCRFSIANNRGNDEAHFFDIVTWNKTAEICGQFLRKGSQVIVSGRLRQSRFTDKATGQNRSKFEIVADSVQFMNRTPGTGGGNSENYGGQEGGSDNYYNNNQGNAAPQSNPQGGNYNPNPPSNFDFNELNENDDIPF